MPLITRLTEGRFRPLGRKRQTIAATLLLSLLTAPSSLAQGPPKKLTQPAAKKEPEIKEELTLKNDDRLTGNF
jgi:hypothetical protein